MAKQKEGESAEDARLTIRVDPDYLAAVKQASKELGINQSIMVRQAIQEYLERQRDKLSPGLAYVIERWRHDRKRSNML